MAIETITVKDAADATKGVLADKIGEGEEYAQVFKFGYGADGALTLLAEKPATEAAQTTGNAALASIDTKLTDAATAANQATSNAALGAPDDAEAAGTSDGTIVGLLKRARTLLGTIASAVTNTLTVGGTVDVANFPATQPVSGPLTDVQLRAAAVLVDYLAAQKTPSGALRVGNTKTKLRDEFPTGGLKSALWDLIATGSGMTVATGNGTTGSYLLISSGTTINSETIVRSKDVFTLPARFAAFVTASQRIANQEFFVELIEVDAAGAPVVGTSQTNAGTAPNYACVKFDGTVATEARVAARSGNAPEFLSAASTITTTVATGSGPNWFPAGMVELQITGEHVQLLQAAIDVTTAATPARRITQCAPDPEALYKLQIRARNLGTAPASTTDWRVHAIRLFDYSRFDVSVIGGPGHSGAGSSVPVNVAGGSLGLTGTPTVVGPGATGAALSGSPVRVGGSDGTNTRNLLTDTTGNLLVINPLPFLVNDVASAALTTTTTTAAITPSFGQTYRVNIPVTAVTGTAPTLDVGVEESDDGGTNWFRVFDFPRITATGIYRSPKLTLTGNRVRYVQTVGGTTPSFTRSVNRLQTIESVASIRQIVDRALAVNTINSATASLNAQNCANAQLVVDMGAITTTAPAFQIEGTDNGSTWYAIGSPLTAVANTTVQVTVANVQPLALRARVSTAGVGATLNSVTLKGF
jgi:hypothetical protein